MTSTASAQSPLAVTVSGLCKRFPGVTALDDVSLDFATGRITAVLGENGAGKSTLMSILAGLQKPDEGVVHVGGRPVDRFSATALLHDHGVALVPQEIALAAERSVAENILMGQEPGVLPSRRRMVGRATSLLDEVGSTIDPRQRAGALSTADQQLLLIVRAIARDCRVLILDEPTTSLTGQEVASLFTLLRRLRDAGTAVIYVSHRLPEIFEICEDIHVLRDGRHVASFGTAQVTPQQLVAAMVGREVAERPYDRRAEGRSVLSLRGLTSAAFADVDLDVRAGEVVGVAGLPDSGRSELLAAIFGAVPSRGSIHLDGEKVTLRSPRDAIKCGIGYVPAVIAVILYSQLPIIRNTYTAITNIDPVLREAARGMGMSDWQRLRQVEIPLAVPVIMAGVRTAVVMNIGVTAIAAYIGAGGLGTLIARGISQTDPRQLVAGALSVSLLAIVADLFLAQLQRLMTSKGIRGESPA